MSSWLVFVLSVSKSYWPIWINNIQNRLSRQWTEPVQIMWQWIQSIGQRWVFSLRPYARRTTCNCIITNLISYIAGQQILLSHRFHLAWRLLWYVNNTLGRYLHFKRNINAGRHWCDMPGGVFDCNTFCLSKAADVNVVTEQLTATAAER